MTKQLSGAQGSTADTAKQVRPKPAPRAAWPQVEQTPLPATLDALLAQAVSRNAHNQAWKFVGMDDHPWGTLTYVELDVAVGQMAAALQSWR